MLAWDISSFIQLSTFNQCEMDHRSSIKDGFDGVEELAFGVWAVFLFLFLFDSPLVVLCHYFPPKKSDIFFNYFI